MTTEKKFPITIPNILSSYRILVFPLLMYFALSGNEKLFAIFLIINLVTDVLDGFIARNFNQQTAIGARLDSIGDIGTYIAAFTGVYVFKWDIISQHSTPIFAFLFFYILFYIVSFMKFKKVPSLHLYSFKTCGYVQGIFFLVLFTTGFQLWFYYLAMAWGIIACIEELIVILVLKELKSDVRSIYFILKEDNK